MAYSTNQTNWTIDQLISRNAQQAGLTGRGLTEPQIAAGISGALEAEYGTAFAQARSERAANIEQQKIDIARDTQKSQEKQQRLQNIGSAVSGVGQLPGIVKGGYEAGKTLGLWGGKAAADTTSAFTSTAAGAGTVGADVVGSTAAAGTAGSLGAGIGTVGSDIVGGAAGLEGLGAGIGTVGADIAGGLTAEAGTAAATTAAATATGEIGTWAAMSAAMPYLAPVFAGIGLFTLFSGSDVSVVCTELHRQGKLDDHTYEADSKVINIVPMAVRRGYWRLFRPVVRVMGRSRAVSAIVAPFGRSCAREFASWMGHGTGSRFGRAILKIGMPVCAYFGRA